MLPTSTYSCSKWHGNKRFDSAVNVVHHKQFRIVLHNHHRKIMPIEKLHSMTNTTPLSYWVQKNIELLIEDGRLGISTQMTILNNSNVLNFEEIIKFWPRNCQKPVNNLKTYGNYIDETGYVHWIKFINCFREKKLLQEYYKSNLYWLPDFQFKKCILAKLQRWNYQLKNLKFSQDLAAEKILGILGIRKMGASTKL